MKPETDRVCTYIIVAGDYDREDDRFKAKLNQLVGVGDTNFFHVYLHHTIKESTSRLLITKLNQREGPFAFDLAFVWQRRHSTSPSIQNTSQYPILSHHNTTAND